jgi:hypothetical protein
MISFSNLVPQAGCQKKPASTAAKVVVRHLISKIRRQNRSGNRLLLSLPSATIIFFLPQGRRHAVSPLNELFATIC